MKTSAPELRVQIVNGQKTLTRKLEPFERHYLQHEYLYDGSGDFWLILNTFESSGKEKSWTILGL